MGRPRKTKSFDELLKEVDLSDHPENQILNPNQENNRNNRENKYLHRDKELNSLPVKQVAFRVLKPVDFEVFWKIKKKNE